jgi:heme exporter protein C
MSSPPTSQAPPRAAKESSVRAAARSGPVLGWLFAVAVLLMAGVYVRAILFTPLEAVQGAAQKIYYLHVPSAIAAYFAVGLTALMSLVYLWLHDDRADRLAEASAEVGLVFLSGVLITGPLWARRIWGTWWTWDARITLTLFLWFVVAAYLVMRGAIEDDAMRARYSAVLGVLGAILIPFIHLSVYLFRTLHPMPIVLKPSQPSLPPEMLTTFLFSMTSFVVLCVSLIAARYRLGVLRDAAASQEFR